MPAPSHLSSYLSSQRLEALKAVCRSFVPNVPIAWLASQIGFDGETAEQECAEFVEDHGATLSADRALLDCKASKSQLVDHSISQKLEEERKEAQRKAEIVPISFS